jgi:hypothetical protein
LRALSLPGRDTPATGLPAPAFEVIAKDPAGYPEQHLRAFLEKPHWPITAFILSPSDIDDILAYPATLLRR